MIHVFAWVETTTGFPSDAKWQISPLLKFTLNKYSFHSSIHILIIVTRHFFTIALLEFLFDVVLYPKMSWVTTCALICIEDHENFIKMFIIIPTGEHQVLGSTVCCIWWQIERKGWCHQSLWCKEFLTFVYDHDNTSNQNKCLTYYI